MELSIVIVNWNTREYLRGCLNSAQKALAGIDAEIIVIDNGSTDGSAVMVKSGFPAITVLENRENIGYSKANNQGIAQSTGHFILLLNPDTVMTRKALSQLVVFMNDRPEAGAVGPRLVLPDGTPQPYAFGDDPTLWYLLKRCLNRFFFHRYLHDWSALWTTQVDWVSGACLMLRREALDQARALDERIFMYFEEVDLCLRIRQKGWKVYYCPQAEVIHFGGQSLRQNPAAQAEYYRSLSYFYSKHYGLISRLVLSWAFAVKTRTGK